MAKASQTAGKARTEKKIKTETAAPADETKKAAESEAGKEGEGGGAGDAGGAQDGAETAGDAGPNLTSTEKHVGETEGANPPPAGDDPSVPNPPDEQHRETDGEGSVETVEEAHTGTQAGEPSPAETGTPGAKTAETNGGGKAARAAADEDSVKVKREDGEEVEFAGSKAVLWRMLSKGATIAAMCEKTGRSSVIGTIQAMARSAGKTLSHKVSKGEKVFKLADA